jgi:hypothetical protein
MGKRITATRPDNHRTLPCAEEISAMGQRNRAALDKARAEGAKTWLSEEFNCAGDGVMRRAWREVPVPEFDDGDWKQKFTADDGTASYDQDAIREAFAHFAKAESEHSAAVRALPPVARRAYATYLRTGRLPEARARAPREARNGRPRGSKRSSSRRSSERSGDSGSEDGESEPPPAGRRCECGCDLPLTGLRSHARFLNDAHRKRYQRERDRLTPERVALRAVENGTATTARSCECKPAHNLVDRGMCVKCCHPRGESSVEAWLEVARDVQSRQLVTRSPARRNPRYGDRKPKPVREFVDESIIEAVAA